MPPSGDQPGAPLQNLGARSGPFNNVAHVVESLLGKVDTSGPVRVIAVHSEGGLAPVGTVDVQIMVSQTDGQGGTMPSPTVYGLPYFRLQGGASAIIMDPQKGDIGLAVYASRDVSAVKSSRKDAPPGSARRFSMSDGFYFGGFLNGVPENFVFFDNGTVRVKAKTAIALESPTLTHNGVDIGTTHRHGGVQAGSAQSGVPVP